MKHCKLTEKRAKDGPPGKVQIRCELDFLLLMLPSEISAVWIVGVGKRTKDYQKLMWYQGDLAIPMVLGT